PLVGEHHVRARNRATRVVLGHALLHGRCQAQRGHSPIWECPTSAAWYAGTSIVVSQPEPRVFTRSVLPRRARRPVRLALPADQGSTVDGWRPVVIRHQGIGSAIHADWLPGVA